MYLVIIRCVYKTSVSSIVGHDNTYLLVCAVVRVVFVFVLFFVRPAE